MARIQKSDWDLFSFFTRGGWYAGEDEQGQPCFNHWTGAKDALVEALGRRLTDGELTLLSVSLQFGPMPALPLYFEARHEACVEGSDLHAVVHCGGALGETATRREVDRCSGTTCRHMSEFIRLSRHDVPGIFDIHKGIEGDDTRHKVWVSFQDEDGVPVTTIDPQKKNDWGYWGTATVSQSGGRRAVVVTWFAGYTHRVGYLWGEIPLEDNGGCYPAILEATLVDRT